MTKEELRKKLRSARREQVAMLPDSMRSLVFHRPPEPLLDIVPEDAVVGLYRANPFEAPASSYAKFFLERGQEIAMPRFADKNARMEFARHSDPFDEEDLEIGPFGLLQPFAAADVIQPDVLFVPLLGFTDSGDRLGQGGGHYDRWLAAHPDTLAVGMAWDCQRVDAIPTEAHDRSLKAVVTPTRFYGPLS